METFEWPVITQSTATVKGSVSRTQYGDGYMQSSPRGLNPIAREYPVVLVGTEDEIAPVMAFLDAHVGGKFYWKPFLAPLGVYYYEEYDVTPQAGDLYTLSVTFKQTNKAASNGT